MRSSHNGCLVPVSCDGRAGALFGRFVQPECGADRVGDGLLIGEEVPTTSVRRSISPLSLSSGLVAGMRILVQSPAAVFGSSRMVRPSGTEAPGARMYEQADSYNELRNRQPPNFQGGGFFYEEGRVRHWPAP